MGEERAQLPGDGADEYLFILGFQVIPIWFRSTQDLLCVLQPVINPGASVYSWVNRVTVALLAEVRRAGLGLCKCLVWSRKWGAGRGHASQEGQS